VRIDSTRFRLFSTNPERYRLYQSLGYRAIQDSPAILLGIAGHEFMDADARGGRFDAVVRECKEKGIPGELISAAEVLAKVLIADYPAGGHVVLSEREFCRSIEGSPHQITGKIDRVVNTGNGFKILDWKFKGNSNYRGLYEQEKKSDCQPGFYLLGAKSWGYQTTDFTFVAAVKSAPIEVWKIPVPADTWTPCKLQLLERSIHITCETIEFYERTFGIEEPWPHRHDAFPCNKDQKYCEYRHICQESHKQGQLPGGFCFRPDHLEIMREGATIDTTNQ